MLNFLKSKPKQKSELELFIEKVKSIIQSNYKVYDIQDLIFDSKIRISFLFEELNYKEIIIIPINKDFYNWKDSLTDFDLTKYVKWKVDERFSFCKRQIIIDNFQEQIKTPEGLIEFIRNNMEAITAPKN